MGDARSIVLSFPAADEWLRESYITWSVYDEADRLVASGLTLGGSHTTLLEMLHTGAAAARRHVRSHYR